MTFERPECIADMLGLNCKLGIVADRQPPAATVDLVVCRQLHLEWGGDDGLHELRLDIVRALT